MGSIFIWEFVCFFVGLGWDGVLVFRDFFSFLEGWRFRVFFFRFWGSWVGMERRGVEMELDVLFVGGVDRFCLRNRILE